MTETSDTPLEAAPERLSGKVNIVMFSGGTGTQSITPALLRHPQISLQIVVNAYDDGLSTGRLRRFIPDMLGPSDIRKNLNRLMPVKERSSQSLKRLCDHRLPVGIPRDEALHLLESMASGKHSALPPELEQHYLWMNVKQVERLRDYLRAFLSYFHEQEKLGRTFDFTDCAWGNIFFAGCFLCEERDFNRTVEAFSVFHEVAPGTLLNITLGENLFLVAEKEDGSALRNEADIVDQQSAAKIRDIYLLDWETYKQVEGMEGEPEGGWADYFAKRHHVPALNPQVVAAINKADVIIYGPGTQHSSLFPSYLTEGVMEAISANTAATKIFVGNIRRDFDIQEDDMNDLARKFMRTMGRNGTVEVDWRQVVNHFFLQDPQSVAEGAKYIPFNPSKFQYPLDTVHLRDWETQEGRHYGGYLVDQVRLIVQEHIDLKLERLHHMVSIIIPVLNEERTISDVLQAVVRQDFQDMDLSKEVILVDGGSTDRTVEIARAFPSVKILQLDKVLGRGAALRTGIEAARGNLIVFFAGDNEYRVEDLNLIVNSLKSSPFKAVFGSRAVKCLNLSAELRGIYGGNTRLYLASKYGGMLLSVMTLLLYNRYVTDILSSVKGFDAELLRDLRLERNGRELDAEIVAKLARRQEYLLELPVDYQPRTRSEGKKITAMDGLACLWALIRYRFRR